MAVDTELSPAEAANRLAVRELFDAYLTAAQTDATPKGRSCSSRSTPLPGPQERRRILEP